MNLERLAPRIQRASRRRSLPSKLGAPSGAVNATHVLSNDRVSGPIASTPRIRDNRHDPSGVNPARDRKVRRLSRWPSSGRVLQRDDSAVRRSRGRPLDAGHWSLHRLRRDPAQWADCHAALLGTSGPPVDDIPWCCGVHGRCRSTLGREGARQSPGPASSRPSRRPVGVALAGRQRSLPETRLC